MEQNMLPFHVAMCNERREKLKVRDSGKRRRCAGKKKYRGLRFEMEEGSDTHVKLWKEDWNSKRYLAKHALCGFL